MRALEMARVDGSAALTVRLRSAVGLLATRLVLEARRAGEQVTGFGWLAERAARREFLGEQFQLALEAAPTGMIVVDLEGRMVRANEQGAKMFGYERSELLGARVEMLVPERLRARHPGFRAGFHASPRARPMGAGRDLYGLCKTGCEIPVEIGLNPLRTAEGDFVLSSIVDITERKRSEHALEQQRLSLEQTSREREILLKEVYHRVKNNLQVISSLLNLQAAQLDDPRARELLEGARSSRSCSTTVRVPTLTSLADGGAREHCAAGAERAYTDALRARRAHASNAVTRIRLKLNPTWADRGDGAARCVRAGARGGFHEVEE